MQRIFRKPKRSRPFARSFSCNVLTVDLSVEKFEAGTYTLSSHNRLAMAIRISHSKSAFSETRETATY